MLIAGIRKDWGEAQANYDEFRFFTGFRPSEKSLSSFPTSTRSAAR